MRLRRSRLPPEPATGDGAAIFGRGGCDGRQRHGRGAVLLDGAQLGDLDTAAPFEIAWDTTTVADGAHTLQARARDTAGNIGESAVITVTVANGHNPASDSTVVIIDAFDVTSRATLATGTAGPVMTGASVLDHSGVQPCLQGFLTRSGRLSGAQIRGSHEPLRVFLLPARVFHPIGFIVSTDGPGSGRQILGSVRGDVQG